MRIIEYSPKKENDINGYTRCNKIGETLSQKYKDIDIFKDKMSIKENDCQLKKAKENYKGKHGNNINYNSKSALVSKSLINNSHTSHTHNLSSQSCNYKFNKATKETKISGTITELHFDEDTSKNRNKAIGSLSNSPKWSRIKDRFEKGESLPFINSVDSLQPSSTENFNIKDICLKKPENKMYSKPLSSNSSISSRKVKSSTLPCRSVNDDLKGTKTVALEKNLSSFKVKAYDITKNSVKLLKESNTLNKDLIKQRNQMHIRPGFKRNESCTNLDTKSSKKLAENHPIPALRTSLNKNKTNQIYTNVSIQSPSEKRIHTTVRTVKEKKKLGDSETVNRYGFKTKYIDYTKSNPQKTNFLPNQTTKLRSDDDKKEQQSNNVKESKVAYLTNKFNSLSCQKLEMKKSNSVVNVDETKCHILSKSFSSTNVFTTLQKSEAENQVQNSSHSECLPIENVPCTAIEKCSCLGLFTKSTEKQNKTESALPATSKHEKICTQPLGNNNLQLQDLKLENEELTLVQKAILSYEENLALSSPETQKKHFISHSKNNSLSSNHNRRPNSNPNSPKPKPVSSIEKEFKKDSFTKFKSDIKNNKNQDFCKTTNINDIKRPDIITNEKKSKSFCLDSRTSLHNDLGKTQTEFSSFKQNELFKINSHSYMNQQEIQLSKSLKPNESFLWSHPTSAQHRKPNTQSEAIYENDLMLCKDKSVNYEKIKSMDKQNSEQTLKLENEYNNIGSCDSDEQESWIDISDIELESEKYSSGSTVTRRNKGKKDLHRKIQARHSWLDRMRAVKNKAEQCNEYQDVSVWETIDGENSSESNDGDPQYEPVYESVYQNISFEGESNSSLSPDDVKHNSETPSEVFDNEEDIVPDSKESSTEFECNKKKLVRNWSLTRSDIRLELTSKLNKIMTKRSTHSSIELGTKEKHHEINAKRNTLMKYFLGQKSNTAGPLFNPSLGKKDLSTFYINIKETELKNSDNISLRSLNSSQHKDFHLKSEQSDNNFKKPHTMKPFLRRTIQRPTAPPPLPPDLSIMKCRTGTKSMEMIRSHSVSFNKTRSLDSTCYNACNDNDILYNEISIQGTSFPNKTSISEISSISTSEGEIISSSSSEKTISGNSSPSYSKSSRHSDNSYSVSSSITDSSVDREMSSIYSECSSKQEKNSSSNSLYQNENIIINGKYDAIQNKLYINDTENLKSPFEEEPLYQFYMKDVKNRAMMWQKMKNNEEHSEIENLYENINEERPLLKSQLSAMELIKCDSSGQRTLWCEVPEVQKSGILSTLSIQDRNLQEAMFEVITSEASYLKSLNILIEHFIQCPEFSDEFSPQCVLNRLDRHILFSDVFPVKEVSERLLTDLENHWKENIMLTDVCDILHNYASRDFSVYIRYCSNQIYQERALKTLKETKPDFLEVLQRLESSPVCQCLDMHSFLMLPMQRITRLPLLVDAIFHRLPIDAPNYENCKMTLSVLNKVVQECNEHTRKMERMEEMLAINRFLDFKDCKAIPLISASRWLVKKGELTRFICDSSSKRTISFSTRWSKVPVYLFLFTDYLLITKKKSEENFIVLDYCPRNMVQVLSLEDTNGDNHIAPRLPSNGKNLFQLTMLNNHKGKTIEIILSANLESERTRWMEAVTPPTSDNPDEKIYEIWDCPQVQCIFSYIAQQPDELTIEECDVVNVFRKMSDGWYEGERIRDGVRGWFPASYTVEIISSHVRARNLRQRYRLMILSQSTLSDKQKEK